MKTQARVALAPLHNREAEKKVFKYIKENGLEWISPRDSQHTMFRKPNTDHEHPMNQGRMSWLGLTKYVNQF